MTISRRIKLGIAYLSQFRLFMQPLHAFGREDVLKLRIIETTELAHLAFKNAAITGRLHQGIGIKIINSLKLSPRADGPAHRADIQRQHISDLVQQSEGIARSEEHTSELQSLMRISYAVFCLKKKTKTFKKSYILTSNTYNKP